MSLKTIIGKAAIKVLKDSPKYLGSKETLIGTTRDSAFLNAKANAKTRLKEQLKTNPEFKELLFLNKKEARPIHDKIYFYHSQKRGHRLPRKTEDWDVHAGTLKAAQDRARFTSSFDPSASRTIKFSLDKYSKVAGAGQTVFTDGQANSFTLAQALKKAGYDAMYYKNNAEDMGSISVRILNPKKIKVKQVKKSTDFPVEKGVYTYSESVNPHNTNPLKVREIENDMDIRNFISTFNTAKMKVPTKPYYLTTDVYETKDQQIKRVLNKELPAYIGKKVEKAGPVVALVGTAAAAFNVGKFMINQNKELKAHRNK